VARVVLALALSVGVVALGTVAIGGLRLDTSVEALLPSDSLSVRSLDTTREALAIDEPLTVLVASDDSSRNRQLAERISHELAQWPETRWVMTRYGLRELAERALYYVDVNILEQWRDSADETLDWEVCKASPFCVEIADPPTLPTSAEVRAAIDASPAGEVLFELTGATAAEAGELGTTRNAIEEAGIDAASGDEDRGVLCNDDGTVCAVQAMVDGDAGDLSFARGIKDRAEAIIVPLERAAPEGTKIRVTGRYRVAPIEHEIILQDLKLVSILAALGSLLLVWLFFGDPLVLVQLAFPMLSGLAIAVGVIAWIEPSLNIISASALAILAGMAIDFGIHLWMHYRSARADGFEPDHAAARSVRELWVSLLVAGVTTACGFAALSTTDFQGFSQMGWMASLGILVTLVWTLAVFPSVVYLIPGSARPVRQRPASRQAHPVVAIGGLLLGIVALWPASRIGFERNLAELQPKVVHHGIDSDVMRARSYVSALYLGQTSAAVAAALKSEAMTEAPLRTLGVEPVVVSSQVILPPDADEKTAILDDMRATLERARQKAIERNDDEAIEEIEEVEPWLDVDGPPSPSHLPPWLSSTLVGADGSIGRSGIIYVPLRGSDAGAMERLARWLDELRTENPRVTFASAEALLGEVTPALIRDAPWILGLVFLGLIVATGVASRSWLVTLDVFLATALSTVFFAAALDLFGMKLHLYNLLALPVVIGLAVDGAVHVRWAQGYADGTRRYATYRAVAASTLTSMVAFAALATASHPGIRSLGIAGTLGLAISLAVNLVWLRAWVGRVRRIVRQ